MAVLQFGVLDVAYSQDEKNGRSHATTTGDVAEILEKNYAVMGTFYELKQLKIATFLADSMARALQDRLNGRTVGKNPMYDADQQIEALFRVFLDANEMNRLSLLLTNVSISAAADRGVSHRRKHPYALRASRPAFIDTGLFRSSFRAVFKP